MIRTLRFLLVFCCFLLTALAQSDPEGVGGYEDGEAIYNKTYYEHTSQLVKKILKGYDLKQRPVRNASQPVNVDVHWHIVHVSIDAKQHTMTVHGHLFMSWIDEFLGWDIDEFDGIRMVKMTKFAVWHPKITVANSVSADRAQYEIESDAHLVLHSKGKELGAKVEMYPVFSMKVGCSFDFAAFPYDQHICSIAIVPPGRMTEVALQIYGELPPTFMLTWGEKELPKITMSDFVFQKITNEILYYKEGGNYSNYEPITANDEANTWSIMKISIAFKRLSWAYFYTTLLPCLISMFLTLAGFLLSSINAAVYLQISNILIHGIFLQELVGSLPVSVSALPRVVLLSTEVLCLNCFALSIHICLLILLQQDKPPHPFLRIVYLLNPCGKDCKTDSVDEHSWSKICNHLRYISLALVSFSCLICVSLYFIQTAFL